MQLAKYRGSIKLHLQVMVYTAKLVSFTLCYYLDLILWSFQYPLAPSQAALGSNCSFSINQTEQRADYMKLLESESQQMVTHRKQGGEKNKENTLQRSYVALCRELQNMRSFIRKAFHLSFVQTVQEGTDAVHDPQSALFG